MHYELIHEDEHILIVNKPAGLLTIPDRAGDKDSLHAQLERKYGKIFIVHRLDRETSGILCFARNAEFKIPKPVNSAEAAEPILATSPMRCPAN